MIFKRLEFRRLEFKDTIAAKGGVTKVKYKTCTRCSGVDDEEQPNNSYTCL